MTFTIILALSAFLLTLLGTRIAILAKRKRVQPVDIAYLRGIAPAPTPRGGGAVIVFSLLICLLAAGMEYPLALALLLLLAVGMMHDLLTVPAPVRMLVRLMAVAIPVSMANSGLFAGLLPVGIDKLLTALLWLWFISAHASLDKIEGLCAAQTVSISAGLCLIAVFAGIFPSPLSTTTLITAAACVGFLWWNWPKAKILMGEAGSVPLGFLLGYFLLQAVSQEHSYVALLLPAFAIADALITRISSLLNPLKPRLHYFEIARAREKTPGHSLVLIIGVNILLVFLAMRCLIDPGISEFNVAMGYLCVFMLLGFFAHSQPEPRHDR